MRTWITTRRPLILTVFLLGCLLLVDARHTGKATVLSTPTVSELRDGDLLFITGKTWRSRIVQLATGKTDGFSHVGLVIMRGKEPYVIHASPTSRPNDLDGSVRVEPIDAFLSPASVVDGAVYRLNSDPNRIAHTAAKVAEEFAFNHIAFDHHFDRTESRTLYCTELVWLAYRMAGLELLGTQPETIGNIILPSTLSQSPYLTEITQFDVVPSFETGSFMQY